jgi:hypothetical protein
MLNVILLKPGGECFNFGDRCHPRNRVPQSLSLVGHGCEM